MSKTAQNFEENSILIIRNSVYCENKCQYFRDLIKLVNCQFVKKFCHSMIDLNSFFRFRCQHMSNKKGEVVDKFSRHFRIVSNDIDKTNELDIDDFINVEINCVLIAFVQIIAENENILLSEYLNESKKTAV